MSPEAKRFRDRLRLPLAVLLATHVLGTVGFWLSWQPSAATLFDGLWMTFNTIATIGFGEVYPLGTAGRLVAMAVAAGGIGTVGYTFGLVLDFLVNEQLSGARRRYRMQRTIDGLNGHFILAGLGRVGREAASEFTAAGTPWVLIDPSEAVVKASLERGELALLGDATEDAVLRAAGLERAKGLVVTTANDATNLYVVLTARLLNPKLYIVCRASDDATVPKMMRAGANKAISPYAIGGRRLAHLLLNPRVVDFFETALHSGDKSLNIGDVMLAEGGAGGRTLADLQLPRATGATVLAVLRRGDEVVLPRGDLLLGTGDHVLALGTQEQLDRLEVLLGAPAVERGPEER
jgi:voltage-gated potassium channel